MDNSECGLPASNLRTRAQRVYDYGYQNQKQDKAEDFGDDV